MGDKPAVKANGVEDSALTVASKKNGKAKPEQEVYGCGFESGPSRPPTPHGIGMPNNFAEVVKGVYRSSFPMSVHLSSLAQLNLKTIVTLVEEEWSPEYSAFVREKGITSRIIPILANKQPDVFTPFSTIVEVLTILLDTRNHPILVHCNKGKHRTGCVMACFRKAQGWNSVSAIAEYIYYSAPKTRTLDRNYIQEFDESLVADLVKKAGAQKWIPTFPPVKYSLDSGEEENSRVNGNNLKKPELGTSAPPVSFHGANGLRHTHSL
ncbi:tyrosine-protein phosphatase SIW14 [Nannizzia gypsea CBS 118893]|uniref:diphosphoinositol-polyphosphate diphosphatase n=1 Tax=Arthroderma gypseum (strain ATCC MYA-4604 / CBS 118893) TaxID=535722 RepID=E5R340_ARTGP|nr:tyrosine-protein phosphatase SIW14 [Nannizzia gypsea CBS 118893]EFQ98744.1 tyrosine-protein phosphatase SIW14 [Nannizzia gypsea CBS 118893]